jgi:hypothetical protein
MLISSIRGGIWAQPTQKDHQYNLLAGYSLTSVKLLGKTPDSQTQFFSIGYQQRLHKYFPEYSFWYTVDVIPYLHYYYPKRDLQGKFVNRSGFGFSPVGFLLTQESSSFFVPFLKTSGGIILMEDEFPTKRSRRLNFTFDITAGGNLNITSFLAVSFGYKFHHISNAETGSENPGLDSNILFLKLTLQ